MAQTSYPFDGQSVTETQFSKLFKEFSDSGVAGSADALDLKVAASGSGMNVTVQPGFAVVRGFAYNSTAVETLTLASSGIAARVDRVVLRLDPATNTVALAVLTGAAGGVAPAPTQTETAVFELPLASVNVGASASTISSDNVVDERTFNGQRVSTWTTSTRPSGPRQGRLGFNRTMGGWEFWDGAAWAPLAPSADWSTITNKPASFTPATHSHAWGNITGKPTTFAPSSHSHPWADITGTSPYSLTSHTHNYAAASHTHAYAPTVHSHDPSDVGIRSGTVTFSSLTAGQTRTVTVSKTADERGIVSVNHASTYILAIGEEVSSTSLRIEVRNSTTSTDHTNIKVNYILVRNA